jgi:O-antigen/teichoic acid export membrane protein
MIVSDNKRIAKNTAMLYFRMLITMCVTLYTSRVILNTLGVEDFGIYNVVGGIVIMFTFLNSAMGASTSRFLIFELGRKDYKQLKKVFSASLSSHIGIALVIFLFAETIGLWFLTHKLVIPADRMNAAHWVYQLSILSSLVSLTQVPYNAAIIAHERMNVYAYVTIVEVVLKLIIVYLLFIGGFDKLKIYAILVFLVSIIIAMIYRVYCKKNYEECSLSFYWDKVLYKKLFSFSVWDAYGGFAIMGMGQGLNMLLNMFFGPIVNAARGIAYQMQAAISAFGNNFMMAVKPQIIKLYAENNVVRMMKLVFASSKYSFFLVYIFSLPLLLETSFVLELWLKVVPDHTVSFCRLILINELIWAMRSPIVTSFHAVGQIKVCNLICGSLFYFIIIVSYLCLKMGFPPESVFIVTIVVSMMVQITELFLLKRLIIYSVMAYAKQVVWLCLLVMVVSAIFPFLLSMMLAPGFIRFLLVGFTSVITVAASVYCIGIDEETRHVIVQRLKLQFGS